MATEHVACGPLQRLTSGAPNLADIRCFVGQMQLLMRLEDWRIDVEASETSEYTMIVHSTPEYRWATIAVGADVLNGTTNHNWRQTVIHEMTHIYGHPFRVQMVEIAAHLPEPLFALFEAALKRHEEALVEETATTIFALYTKGAP